MKCETHVMKRDGHLETFDLKKIYQAAYEACLNVHLSLLASKKIAQHVVKDIKELVKNKPKIKSDVLFAEVARALYKHNEHVAFMYETHRDIS